MDSVLVNWLTHYGPLAMGWPVAWYFVRQNTHLQSKVLEIAVANISTNSELKSTVQALGDIIKLSIKRD